MAGKHVMDALDRCIDYFDALLSAEDLLGV